MSVPSDVLCYNVTENFFFSHQDFIPVQVFILWDLSSFQISKLTPCGVFFKTPH